MRTVSSIILLSFNKLTATLQLCLALHELLDLVINIHLLLRSRGLPLCTREHTAYRHNP